MSDNAVGKEDARPIATLSSKLLLDRDTTATTNGRVIVLSPFTSHNGG